MTQRKMPEWAQEALKRSVGHRYYPLVVALIAFASTATFAFPFFVVLIPAVLLAPRRWLLLGLLSGLTSGLGGAALDMPACATIGSLVTATGNTSGAKTVPGEDKFLAHAFDIPLSLPVYKEIASIAKCLGVTRNFREVIDYFKVPAKETPAGFKLGFVVKQDGLVQIDLIRDISYDKNGQKRPTSFLFSADSANPYEVAPIKDLIGNLTWPAAAR